MRYTLLYLITLLSIHVGISQIRFEPGYIIDNQSNQIKCLIKNIGWFNNPDQVIWKLHKNDLEQISEIDSILAFAIYGDSKFVRILTPIDRSRNHISKLTYSRKYDSKIELLMLRQIVEGELSLYSYFENDLQRYYYKFNEAPIVQLEYKKFKDENNNVKTNNHYKQQLKNKLVCSSISDPDIERLAYTDKSLSDLIIKYYDCLDGTPKFFQKKNEVSVNIFIKPGLSIQKLKIGSKISSSRNTTFLTKASARLGAELELILPFNKNKWSIIFSPALQSYKSESKDEMVTVDYTSLEIPIGLRHSFYIGSNSNLFIDLLVIWDYDFDSAVQFQDRDWIIDTKTLVGKTIGLGYELKNKYHLELSYSTNNSFFKELPRISDIKKLTLSFGVKLF